MLETANPRSTEITSLSLMFDRKSQILLSINDHYLWALAEPPFVLLDRLMQQTETVSMGHNAGVSPCH